ncbi:MAG: DUF349 domain-containing protein [Pseudohongiellaceae bacterium]
MTAAGEQSEDQAGQTITEPARPKETDKTQEPSASTPFSDQETPEQPSATEPSEAEPSPEPSQEPSTAATPSEPVPEQAPEQSTPSLPFPDEEKKALIEAMTALKDSEMHLATRARRIRTLQETWHSHGTPDEADPLWQQFNELGREAFEPCKTYFQERKKLMRTNLAERKQICEQLEAWVAALDNEKDADIGEVNRLEKQARDQWRKYAPVPQKQVAALQGRFNEVLKALRAARRKTLQAHAARKKQLVEQAAALLEAEDLPAALNEAKRLQKEWKQVGPAPHKDERTLWETFRKHCDALFARRPPPSAKAGQKRGPAGGKGKPGPGNAGRPPAPRIGKKQQTLIDTLMPAARLLREAEEQNLSGQAPDTDALRQQWEAIELPSGAEQAAALRQRFEQLTSDAASAETLQQAARDNADRARALCIELEIQAGLDSPAEDKALRMQRQLEHLKQGLGQGLADAATRSQRLGETMTALLCMGPLSTKDRKAFEQRLQRIR